MFFQYHKNFNEMTDEDNKHFLMSAMAFVGHLTQKR